MKLKLVLLGLCAVGLAVGLGGLYLANAKLTSDNEQLRAQNQQLLNSQASAEGANGVQLQKANEELARLRKDNAELLTLRNQLRQLKDEKQQLANEVKTAQVQAQNAQAQTAQAKAQAEALRTNSAMAQKIIDPATGLPVTTESLRARYGLGAATPEQAQANVCINNLRQIEGAKQQWALENSRTANSAVMPTDISRFFPNNTLPTCPAGGTYTLNVVGALPVCTVQGHSLTK